MGRRLDSSEKHARRRRSGEETKFLRGATFLRGALPSGWHMSEYLAATFSACPKELNELDGRHLLRRTGCSAEPLQNP